MSCCIPLKSRGLDVNIMVLKPTVMVDQLVEALKHFTTLSVTFGCIHSAILQCIHGNTIIWYGAWMKRSEKDTELLTFALKFMLAKISSLADIVDNNLFEAYGGESKERGYTARFSTGDTVSFCSVKANSSTRDNYNDAISQIGFPKAVLATFRSHFRTMNGAISGVCLKKHYNNYNDRGVLNFIVWESRESCYSYAMRSDRKYLSVPNLKGLASLHFKFDMYRVIHVAGENVPVFQHNPWPPHFILPFINTDA